jgi:hypothetical protein
MRRRPSAPVIDGSTGRAYSPVRHLYRTPAVREDVRTPAPPRPAQPLSRGTDATGSQSHRRAESAAMRGVGLFPAEPFDNAIAVVVQRQRQRHGNG